MTVKKAAKLDALAQALQVTNPLPEMEYEKERGLWCAQLPLGNSALNPETVQAMVETHNGRIASKLPSSYVSPLNWDIVDFDDESSAHNNAFIDQNFGWNNLDAELEDFNAKLQKEYDSYFDDRGDTTAGMQGLDGLEDGFADPTSELMRQENLLSSFLFEF